MKVAITGHRPQRLNGHGKDVKRWIAKELSKIECDEAYTGMAMGTDQIFANVAISKDIPLVCCYPYRKNKFHPDEQKIIDSAKDVEFISEEFSKKAYWIRDKYMVDHCDVLLAVWDGEKSGGTWITVEYAQKIGKPIIFYPKERLRE